MGLETYFNWLLEIVWHLVWQKIYIRIWRAVGNQLNLTLCTVCVTLSWKGASLTQVHLRGAQKAERQSLQMRHPHYHHAPAIKGQDAQHESNPWSNSKMHQIAGNKTVAEVSNHSCWLLCGYQAESFLRLSELNTTMNGMDDDGGIRRLPTSCYQRSRIDARCIGCTRSRGHAKPCPTYRR